ncbi:MAG: acetyltransferase [Roseivirga sp.]
MSKPVIIFGAQGLGKVALEILQQNEVVVYGFLDDTPAFLGKEVNHVPVLGTTTDKTYLVLLGEHCEACVAVEPPSRQQRLVAMLREQRQVVPINAIHPAATVASSAVLGHGNLINAGVRLSADTTVGSHCLLHTQAVVEHGAVVKDFVQLGPGSIVGAETQIDEQVFVGAGATILAGIKIGVGASIGVGAVVLADVEPGATVLGNPAAPIKSKQKSLSVINE